ncbi:MAG: hypothetical protein WEE89_07290 [Gemmatimonadota bacterium]
MPDTRYTENPNGALIAGLLADRFGIPAAINAVAEVTALSGLWVIVRMPETVE